MIAPLVIAAAIGATFEARSCAAGTPVARIHLVDGMPFVAALRRTIRVRFRREPPGGAAEAYAIDDGHRTVAYLRNQSNGTWDVAGFVREDKAGGFVDVLEAPRGCSGGESSHATLTSQ